MTTPDPSPVSPWRGPAVISAGLVVLGVASYAFLTVAARVLSPVEYAELAAFWSLVFAVLAGTFFPFELEGTRMASAARVAGRSVQPPLRRLARIAAAVAGVLLLVIVLGRQALANALFSGDETYVALLAVMTVTFAVIYLGRGALAGTGRFLTYSVILSGEGLVRVLLLVVVAAAAIASGAAAAAAMAGASVLAALATVALVGRPSGPAATSPVGMSDDERRAPANLGALLVASLAAQGLINAGPLTAQALGDDAVQTGAILAVFVLVRVPVMFITAIQSGFIPALVTTIEGGDIRQFNHVVSRVLARVAVVGTVIVIGAAVFGPLATRLLFGPRYELQPLDYAVLTASSVAFMVAALLQAVLVALQRHRSVAIAWLAGVVAYAGALLLPLPLLRVVEIGAILSMGTVCVVMWGAIHIARPAASHLAVETPAGER